MLAAGIDIGTSGVKCTVFNEDLKILGHAYAEYHMVMPHKGEYELEPDNIFNSVINVLSEAARACRTDKIDAISITSFGESFVCLDKHDKPLSNFMLYIDTRGSECCRELAMKLSEADFHAKTGQYFDPMFSVFKLRYLADSRRMLPEKTSKICFVADYIAYRLGSEHICEYSLASRSGMFDIDKKDWWKDAIDFSGFKSSSLPHPVSTGTCTGRLSASAAELAGIEPGSLLILGGHDQICAAIGSGATESGDVANGMGTVDCMTVLVGSDVNRQKLLKSRLTLVPYIKDGLFASYAVNFTGGSILKWFRNNFARELCEKKGSYALLDAEASGVPSGIVVVPDFAGADETALLCGINLATNRGEIYRAFLEGETFKMKTFLDTLASAGYSPGRIAAVGGGAISPLWMQIRADIFQRDILIPERTEAGTLAAALICFTSLGIFSNIEQAQKAAVQYRSCYKPNSALTDTYKKAYRRYIKARALIKEIYYD